MSFESLRNDANYIIENAIKSVLPDKAVQRALESIPTYEGKLYLVAIGKAAWQMTKAASDICGSDISRGIVITKYGHVKGELDKISCLEAGHPVPDENSFKATEQVIEMVSGLNEEDLVLFLVSGGGSALFEKPLISGEELADITQQLLDSGASIDEMNAIRKRLSAVKGGRFAKLCEPAKVFSIVLSDVIGDSLDVIASGPAYPDSSNCRQANNIIKRYEIRLSDEARECLQQETPKEVSNVTTVITGSVKELCRSAVSLAEELGYETSFLTDELKYEAKEAGVVFAKRAALYNKVSRLASSKKKIAIVEGGETVVKVRGEGKGGRNQEFALAAAPYIDGKTIAIFSVGSDGTDGPTDAAGGYVDGRSYGALTAKKIDVEEVLWNNDAYTALEAIDGLIITGPTGTNVNDLAVALIEV